jgi:rRNA maturation endonuclease Nob1
MDRETVNYIIRYYPDLLTQDEKLALTYQYFLDPSIEEFRINVAKRVLSDNPQFKFNNCPNCGKLARTPEAKQCSHCGHSWRGD